MSGQIARAIRLLHLAETKVQQALANDNEGSALYYQNRVLMVKRKLEELEKQHV